MAEQGVEVGEMEQAVQQPAVPQMPLGMLDEPLRRLLHIGRKPPPKKRAVGDLKIVPRGRRRDAQTAGYEIPVAPSLQVEPAPIGRQRPSQRGLAALPRAKNGNAGKRREILGKKWLTGWLHTLQNETLGFEMQGIRGVDDSRTSAAVSLFSSMGSRMTSVAMH
jgi:hypothetical protein